MSSQNTGLLFHLYVDANEHHLNDGIKGTDIYLSSARGVSQRQTVATVCRQRGSNYNVNSRLQSSLKTSDAVSTHTRTSSLHTQPIYMVSDSNCQPHTTAQLNKSLEKSEKSNCLLCW